MKLFEYWIGIPRWIKQGTLTGIVLFYLFTLFIYGLKGVINLFNNPLYFFTHVS